MAHDRCFTQTIQQAITELKDHDSPVNNKILVGLLLFYFGIPLELRPHMGPLFQPLMTDQHGALVG
jgi:hypothetical protein